MQFHHRFQVNAPQAKVAAFHRSAAALKAITPPVAFLRLHHVTDPLSADEPLTFTLWLGPIPVFWESRFTDFTETGFVDTQGRGPFQSWRHEHRFVVVDEHHTEVVDHIEVTLRPFSWDTFVALLLWSGLPVVWLYRSWRTRRLLEG